MHPFFSMRNVKAFDRNHDLDLTNMKTKFIMLNSFSIYTWLDANVNDETNFGLST